VRISLRNTAFRISPELTKAALRTVKLSDVTLADLAAMTAETSEKESATAERLAEKSKIRPFPRRI
jgi:hypothetical protein